MRSLVKSSLLVLAAILAVAGGCNGDRVAGSAGVDSTLAAGPFVVSNAVRGTTLAAEALPAQRGVMSASDVAYISLATGTIPNGVAATIRKLHTATVVSVDVVDGGFDPVSISAASGDTLSIVLQRGNGAGPLNLLVVVPAATRPVVVRTNPPPKKRDVPWNASIVIVFSEPIDSTTLTSTSVSLRQGSAVIAAQLVFGNAAHTTVLLVPSAPLAGATDYELRVTPAIVDLDGTSLGTTIVVPFTTDASPPASSLQVSSTYPVAQQGNVPVLEPLLEVVFSSPVAMMSLFDAPGHFTVQLRRGGNTVSARPGCKSVGPVMNCFSIFLLPNQPLAPGADYELVVPQGIQGTDGTVLAAPVVIPFTTENPPPGPSTSVLSVASFTMIEFQYPGDPSGHWNYAPRIRLAETGGLAGASLIKMTFTIPGLRDPSPTVCSSGLPIGAGQIVDLFGEAFGDYEVTFSDRDGARGTAGAATAILYFRGSAGRVDSLTASGTVVGGDPPLSGSTHPVHPYYVAGPSCFFRSQ